MASRIAHAGRIVALVLVATLIVAIGVRLGASIADASDSDVDHSCGSPYVLQPSAERSDAQRLTLSVQPAPLDFRRSRTKKLLQFEFRSVDPAFFVDAQDPLHATADLYGDGTIYRNTAVPVVSVTQGVALVDVCIDPTAEHLSAGSYNGTLRIVDQRVAYTSVSFAVSLQYGLQSHLLTWVLFSALVLFVSLLVAWFVASQASGGRGQPTQPLTRFVADNRRALLFGVGPFGLTWSSIYLQDTAWPGDFESFFWLFQASTPAVVGAISAAAIYHSMPSPSTVLEPNYAGGERVEVRGSRTVGRSSRGPVWAALALALCVGSVLVAMVVSRSEDRSTAQQVPIQPATTLADGVTSTSTHSTDGDSPSSSSTPHPSTSPPPTFVQPADGVVDVPDLFGTTADEALASLEQLGFGVVSYQVCSSSVPAGAVRQILVRASQEIAVDKQGVLDTGRNLPRGTALEVKIGSGSPCN
jgi:hypothetical protein